MDRKSLSGAGAFELKRHLHRLANDYGCELSRSGRGKKTMTDS